MTKPNPVEVKDAVNFTCPFCGSQCTATLEHGAVFHGLPMCEKFEQLDPVEFLAAVNARRAN